MGSYNTLTVLAPDLNQQPVLQLKPEKEPVIYLLTNSIYYFIQCVFIRKENHEYRLVALHHGRVLCDKLFHTLKDCKNAFNKMFQDKGWKDNLIPHWSIYYEPEKEWLLDHAAPLES